MNSLLLNMLESYDSELVNLRSAYLAYDLFPSSKGAATHISHMAKNLFDYYQSGALITLGNKQSLPYEGDGNIVSLRFNQQFENYLVRAQAYSKFAHLALAKMPKLTTLHFRDTWSGMAAYAAKPKAKHVYEVNGLASIELPYRYPLIPSTTLDKLESIEKYCLAHASSIVVPSDVIAAKVAAFGVSDKSISVVRNAADPSPEFSTVGTEVLGDYLIYFGATQSWQGVESLIRAFALLRDLANLKLLICSSTKPSTTKLLKKLARNLGVEDTVVFKHQLPKSELNSYIRDAKLSIAPLTACSRNLEQGCSPLKIFESMACGTAVVASKLPVVEEIVREGETAKLVRPDRPHELARAIRILLEYPELSTQLATAAKQSLEENFTWAKVKRQMNQVYGSL